MKMTENNGTLSFPRGGSCDSGGGTRTRTRERSSTCSPQHVEQSKEKLNKSFKESLKDSVLISSALIQFSKKKTNI